MSSPSLASLVDHTLLSPTATDADALRLARECIAHGFFAACVDTRHIPVLVAELRGHPTRIAAVAGFPLGTADSAVKAFEAKRAVELGAHEVDMVLAIGDLKAGLESRVENEIRLVRDAIPEAVLKVILECGLLTDGEKETGARIAVAAGADFVKTSTGFGHGGATVEDVRLLRQVVGPDIGVKASGGIRDAVTAHALVAAGATRLGTSSGVAIVSGAEE